MEKRADVTPNRIISDLKRAEKAIKRMKKPAAPRVTVIAGKTACDTLRKRFPEDGGPVKIVECVYLEENQCFVMREGRNGETS